MSGESFRLPPLRSEPPHGFIDDQGGTSDLEYARKLTAFLDEETAKIDRSQNREENFALHRACFDRIAGRLPAYGPLLTTIKAEYERFVDALRVGEANSFYLETRLRNMDGEAETAKVYEKRYRDLESKVKIIESNNKKLEEKIKCLREERERREAEAIKIFLNPNCLPEMTTEKRQRVLTKITLDKSTNIEALERELAELELNIRMLREAETKRFVAKSRKGDLLCQLEKKEELREKVLQSNEDLKQRLFNLRMGIEATLAFDDNLAGRRLSLSEVVEKALAGENLKKLSSINPGQQTPSSVEDDDPAKEKETQMILEYMERWNELLGEEKYEAAAIHAANSPKGVLRNSETFLAFKNVKQVSGGEKSPLLIYCEILLSTVTHRSTRPSKADSVECVKCALDHGKLELVAHWLANDVLECCVSMGAIIEEYAVAAGQQRDAGDEQRLAYSLAVTSYMRCGADKQAAICMCKQGRLYGMVAFARDTGSFKSEDYIGVLEAVPELEVGLVLVGASLVGVYRVLQVLESDRKGFLKALGSREDLIDIIRKDGWTSSSDWTKIVIACEEENVWEEGINIVACELVNRVLFDN